MLLNIGGQSGVLALELSYLVWYIILLNWKEQALVKVIITEVAAPTAFAGVHTQRAKLCHGVIWCIGALVHWL